MSWLLISDAIQKAYSDFCCSPRCEKCANKSTKAAGELTATKDSNSITVSVFASSMGCS